MTFKLCFSSLDCAFAWLNLLLRAKRPGFMEAGMLDGAADGGVEERFGVLTSTEFAQGQLGGDTVSTP